MRGVARISLAFMRFVWRRAHAALVWAVLTAACGVLFGPEYEYEEDLHLSLDGSATVYVNASVPALVALRGIDLPVDPQAHLDRRRVRTLFEGDGARVTGPTLSRRRGRRFVHIRVDVADLRDLPRLAGLAWSSYRFERRTGAVEYRQVVGSSASRSVGHAMWNGTERVVFRLHIPSEIPFHNSPRPLRRGNILEWDQRLDERLGGSPVEMRVQMEPQSILYRTLLLFGSTVAAAALAFGVIIWWISRRGSDARTAAAG